MVTVHWTAATPADGRAPFGLDMSVTLLRTRAERFVSHSRGELAFALLAPAGLLALLRAPLQGATHRRVALAEFCGASDWRALRDALCSAGNVHQRHRFGVSQARVAQAASLIQAMDHPQHRPDRRARLATPQRSAERRALAGRVLLLDAPKLPLSAHHGLRSD
jgi:hypothetical protein